MKNCPTRLSEQWQKSVQADQLTIENKIGPTTALSGGIFRQKGIGPLPTLFEETQNVGKKLNLKVTCFFSQNWGTNLLICCKVCLLFNSNLKVVSADKILIQ